MRATSIIFRRELGAYLRSPLGWIIAAVLLAVDGVLFQAMAMSGDQLSANVLNQFFMLTSIVTSIAAIALSVRLVAEERQQHSMILLNTSPVRDVEIIVGKFLAAFVFLAGMILISLYMPLLIKVHGKVSFNQIAVGYLGLFLLGGAVLAIGTFASSLTKNQLIALVLGAAMAAVLHLLFWVAKIVDPPVRGAMSELALWGEHFQLSFQNGILNLKDVVYYLAITYFFLLLSVKTLEAKRWQ
jgi:gliding motility-associated transport system permease protein